MKIGIITHHYIKNFGAFWQSYALQQALRKLLSNDDIYIINYKNKKHYIANIRPFFIRKMYKCSLNQNICAYFDGIRQFIGFIKCLKMLRLSKNMKNASDINKECFDVIIIGSDEVWNTDAVGVDKVKFGIGLDAKRIISYAASTGSVDDNYKVPDFVKTGLQRFSAISVRDTSSQKLVKKHLRYKPCIVLDPTFLHQIPYIPLGNYKSITTRNYILVYHCNLTNEYIMNIKKFAKDNNLVIVGAGHFGEWFDYNLIDINPLEWNYLFKKAKYILTGTFHGTAFSLIHNKLFCVYPTSINRIKKVRSLLEELNLMERVLNNESNIIEILNSPIDYNLVNLKLDEMKEISLKFLKNSLLKL